MDKDQLRQKLERERESLSFDEWTQKSQEACSQLLSFPWIKNSQRIALYSSKKNELSLSLAHHELLQMGKEIAYPHVSDKGLVFYQADQKTGFKKSSFGVLEPMSDKILEDIEVYVIPAVAYDLKGNRLGWGKGYYDQCLASSYAKKIGMAFDFQILDALPFEKHDVRMDVLISEKRILESL